MSSTAPITAKQVATVLVARDRIADTPMRKRAGKRMPRYYPQTSAPSYGRNPAPNLHMVSWAPRVHTPNGISVGSAVFAGLLAREQQAQN